MVATVRQPADSGAEDRETPKHVVVEGDADTVVRLLRGVERLPKGATGALIFGEGESRIGTLLVEDKRVCWASAEGMETRLTDILRTQAEPPIPYEVMEGVYDECRRSGTPLGAALISKGLVGSRGLEQALRLHTGEAILRLSRALKEGPFSPSWVPNRLRRYDAQFTFTPAEILVCVGSLSDPESTERAHRNLQPILEDSVVAAAFFEGSNDGLPVAQVCGEDLGVRGLVTLGRWGRSAVEAAGFAAGDRLVSATNQEGQTAVAWKSKGIIYSALCQNRRSLSILITRRARAAAKESNR